MKDSLTRAFAIAILLLLLFAITFLAGTAYWLGNKVKNVVGSLVTAEQNTMTKDR